MAAQRSVHFPLASREAEAAAEPAIEQLAPAIVTYGRLLGTHQRLGKELRHLTLAESDYHGTLQAMRTAAQALVRDIGELITLHEGTGR